MSKIKQVDPGYVLRRKKHAEQVVEKEKVIEMGCSTKKGKGKAGKGSKKSC